MIKEFLLKLLENERLLVFLITPIKYSFIIWLLIIGWFSYKFFQEYKYLSSIEEKKQQEYLQEYKVLRQKISKLKDIKTSYETITKYFSPKEVELVKKKLDYTLSLIEGISKAPLRKYETFPFEITTFNLEKEFSQRLFKLNSFTLESIQFKPESNDYFEEYLTYLYKKSANKIKTSGKVNAAIGRDKILLTLVPAENGILKLESVFSSGFVSNIFSNPYFMTSTILKTNQLKNVYSNFYFGWSMKLQREVK
jgi:hypothetical protein